MADEIIFDANLEDFEERVLQASASTPVVVDFWADWCPPCVSLDPVLKKVIAEFEGKVLLARIEVDEGENMKLAGQYQLRGFPTVLVFINGEEQGRFSGFKPAEQIRDFLAGAGVDS